MAKTNSEHQREWYYRQKNSGIVYLLTIDGETYVGSTTNSLNKRLYQHRTHSYLGELLGTAKSVKIEELERATKPSELRELEQKWIETLSPTINKNAALAVSAAKKCYKGGVKWGGQWFPTKLDVWKQYGKTPLGTFKSRLWRYNNLDYALGTIELKKEGSI